MSDCLIGEKHHPADVGYLCRGHLEKLGGILRQIEDEAIHLDARPSMAIRTGSGKGSLASERAPARLDVLVHTDRRRGTGKSETDDDALAAGETLPALEVLHAWARVIREERDLAEPRRAVRVRRAARPSVGPFCETDCPHGSCEVLSFWLEAPAEPTITGERDLLTRHLDWIAEQLWVDECFGDLRKLLGQLKGSNGTQDEKPVGRCYLPAEDGACNGPIWVDSAAGHAHCGRCRETWNGAQLAMLGWELERLRRPRDEDGEPLWSADEIAREHNVKAGTIAVWAHRRGIVSVGGYYDPRAFRDKATA